MESKKILIIEDNHSEAFLLKEMLKDEGVKEKHVILKNKLRDSIEFLKRNNMDAVILDLNLPDSKGLFSVEELIKNFDNDFPIVVLTVMNNKVMALNAVKAGAQDYLIKGEINANYLSRSLLYAIERHLVMKERLEMAEKLKKYASELEEANSTKDLLFSIIAHDLRSPFAVLSSMINILVDHFETLDKDEIIKFAYELKDTVQTQYKVVDNLLTWVHMQKGRLEFNPTRIFLIDKINLVIEQLKVQAEAKNILINNNVDNNIVIYGDRDMLQSVIHNLIYNGIKYSYPGGRIDIISEKKDSQVITSITDQGTGISEETKSIIFTIDKKVKKLGTADERGTGLGLHLTKEMVEKQGGKIWLESELGKGSTFYFTLPSGNNIKVS